MIITIVLVNTSIISHNYHFFYLVRTFKIYSLSNFQAYNTVFVVVQVLSHVWLFVTPLTAAHQASLSLTITWSLLKLMSIESVLPSSHLVLCRPLLLLPSKFPNIRVCSNESALRIRWPKYWSLSFSEYSGLISFSIDWFDLVVQGAVSSLLQNYSFKASILECSAFITVQLSLVNSHVWVQYY